MPLRGGDTGEPSEVDGERSQCVPSSEVTSGGEGDVGDIDDEDEDATQWLESIGIETKSMPGISSARRKVYPFEIITINYWKCWILVLY